MVLWLASSILVGEDIETVDLGGKAGGDGRDRLVAALGDFAGAAGSVDAVDGLELVLADELAALAERHAQRLHGLDVLERRALDPEQVHLDAEEMLADDLEAAFGQQVIDVSDAAIERVLDRHHAIVGGALTARPRWYPRR